MPKQFVPLMGDLSLLELTLQRFAGWAQPATLVASEEHRFMVLDAVQRQSPGARIVLEPEGRNTAAAMAIAALAAHDQDDLLLFCPADHHIPDVEAFRKTVEAGAVVATAGAVVTFGVVPTFPSTAYGYIERGASRADGAWQVRRFIEKPDASKARDLLLRGGVLWNAGIFLVRAGALVAALEAHAADILAACRAAMLGASQEQQHGFVRPEPAAFLACRSQSIDYAVMEHHQNVAVLPLRGNGVMWAAGTLWPR